jgi:hypothetical protein
MYAWSQTTELSVSDTTKTAEVDSLQQNSQFSFKTGASLNSRSFWRGVKFGSGVSVQGFADLSMVNEKGNGAFGFGAFSTNNFNGSFLDFGNTMNLYMYYYHELNEETNLTFIIDDYFFYSEDNIGQAFDYTSDTTLHYIEARIKANVGKWDGLVAYSIYQGKVRSGELDANGNSTLIEQDTAPYIELGYSVNTDVRIFAGGVTGASALNFMNNSGITNVGVTQRRYIRNMPFEFTLVCNPSYQKISNFSLGRPATASAFTFIAAIML